MYDQLTDDELLIALGEFILRNLEIQLKKQT